MLKNAYVKLAQTPESADQKNPAFQPGQKKLAA